MQNVSCSPGQLLTCTWLTIVIYKYIECVVSGMFACVMQYDERYLTY